jgi:hypothetical protein
MSGMLAGRWQSKVAYTYVDSSSCDRFPQSNPSCALKLQHEFRCNRDFGSLQRAGRVLPTMTFYIVHLFRGRTRRLDRVSLDDSQWLEWLDDLGTF